MDYCPQLLLCFLLDVYHIRLGWVLVEVMALFFTQHLLSVLCFPDEVSNHTVVNETCAKHDVPGVWVSRRMANGHKRRWLYYRQSRHHRQRGYIALYVFHRYKLFVTLTSACIAFSQNRSIAILYSVCLVIRKYFFIPLLPFFIQYTQQRVWLLQTIRCEFYQLSS